MGISSEGSVYEDTDSSSGEQFINLMEAIHNLPRPHKRKTIFVRNTLLLNLMMKKKIETRQPQ